jgi:hypothetical protein
VTKHLGFLVLAIAFSLTTASCVSAEKSTEKTEEEKQAEDAITASGVPTEEKLAEEAETPEEKAAASRLSPAPVPEAAPSVATPLAEGPLPEAPPPDPAAAQVLADKTMQPGNDSSVTGLPTFQINSELGRVESTCATKGKGNGNGNGRFVLLMKQWHLSPNQITKPNVPGTERQLNKKIPQAENQIALYRMLETWISQDSLKTVLVEGCSRGISRGFETRYNGWNLRALEKRAADADYASVITHLGLKLEAKLGPVVDTVCADSGELIRAHNLAFSDARGVAGFLSRLEGASSDDPKVRTYLMSVIDMYGLPPSTTTTEAITKLRGELKDVINRVQRGFEERNKLMVRKAMSGPARPMALIVGGAHAPDLKARLEKEGVGCAVITPVGYRSEDDELLSKLSRWQ